MRIVDDIVRIIVLYLRTNQLVSFFLTHGLSFDMKFRYDGMEDRLKMENFERMRRYFPHVVIAGFVMMCGDYGCSNVISMEMKRSVMRLELYYYGGRDMYEMMDGFDKLRYLRLHEKNMFVDLGGVVNCPLMMRSRWCGKNSWKIREIDWIANCENLRVVDLYECQQLVDLSGFSNCARLRSVKLVSCDSLSNISDALKCDSLRNVYVERCKSLVSIDLRGCGGVRKLEVYICESLMEVLCCGNMYILRLDYCEKICLVRLDGCSRLSFVELYSVGVETLSFLSGCSKLKHLKLYGCMKLEDVKLMGCSGLEIVELFHCVKLRTIKCLRKCVNLKRVSLCVCSMLDYELRGAHFDVVIDESTKYDSLCCVD